MPSCNLVETVHNNQATRVMISTLLQLKTSSRLRLVEDFVLILVVRYYQYLKGEHGSTGLGKKELLLQVVERST
jgi:hypothetical protein